MTNAIVSDAPLARISEVLVEQGIKLTAAAVVLIVAGLYLFPQPFEILALSAGATLISLAVLGQALVFVQTRGIRGTIRDIDAVAKNDLAPCLLTQADGEVRYVNPAASKRFKSRSGGTLVQALGDLFANPAGVLFRLQEKASAVGGAREEVVTRRGHIRLTVVALAGDCFLWRFEEMAEPRMPAKGLEGFSLPMLIVNKAGNVQFMNEALRQTLGGGAKYLDRMIDDLPVRSGAVHQVSTPQGTKPFRLFEIAVSDDRAEIYFLPVEMAEADKGLGRLSGIEDLPVGLLQLQADGQIAEANKLARDLLEPEANVDLVGLALGDRLEALGRPVRDWLEEAAQGHGLGRPEVLRVRSAETETFLQVTLGRIVEDGRVSLVAVLNDATELKTLEAQFVQSQKMQAIGQLAGGVAHDFNNLLTAISGHCDLMLLRHDQGDPDYGDLVQIHQNANRAASLVGQLLAFSRKQTLQPQIIDLRDTLSDLTHLLNRLVGERVALTLQHETDLPPIRADKRQLEQVIMNLVVNARDAMPEGGEIRVETVTRVLGDELRRDRAKVPPGRYVVVKVEDHGTGIPPDKLSKIFEPFYTTKRTGEGTGLGLSTAYGIVKQSGGFIFVDSVVGNGTAFTLYFPAHEPPAEIAALPEKPSPAKKARANSSAGIVWQAPAFAARGNGAAAGAVAFDNFEMAETVPVAASDSAISAKDEVELGIWTAAQDPEEGPAVSDDAGDAAAIGVVEADDMSATVDVAHLTEVSDKDAALSSENAGTTPDLPIETGQGIAQVPASPPKGEGVILLVEDEAPVRAFASRALRMRGYTVIEAENAEEALATLEDEALEIDVFVTDVIMPGLDGPSWVRQALEKRPGVKVVFVSGYAEDSFGEEQAKIPNSVFLPKPFSLSELTATVQDQIL